MTPFRNSILASLITGIFVSSLQLTGTLYYERRSDGKSETITVRRLTIPLGLEFSGLPEAHFKMQVSPGSHSTMGFFRENLTMLEQQPERPITGVMFNVEGKNEAIQFQAWATFNDLHHPQEWKYRVQESLGSFLLHEGESVSLDRLTKYGMKPFSIKAVSARPISIPLDQARLKNNTKSLEFVSIVKQLDVFSIKLRNNSERIMAAYSISTELPFDTRTSIFTPLPPENYIPPYGEFHCQLHIPSQFTQVTAQGTALIPVDEYTIAINLAIFSDNSFEGNEKAARNFFANRDGRNKELELALPVLREIVKRNDVDLIDAWEKFKIRISEFPQEEKARRGKANSTPEDGDIFWKFEEGMYQGRNLIQSEIDQLQSRLEEPTFKGSKVQEIRKTIIRLISVLEKWSRYSI